MAKSSKRPTRQRYQDDSRLWVSDREIGSLDNRALPYTTDELRSELKRVERKRTLVTILFVLVALAAVVVAVLFVLRIF